MLKKLLILFLLMGFAQVAIADDDDDDEHEGMFKSLFGRSSSVPAQNKLYQSECSSCHFAYQASLLPSRSWKKLMLSEELSNHFGDNAELDEAERLEILTYLVDASDKSRALIRYPKNATPMRITTLPYFIREHDELPKRMVQGNPKVKSFSNCLACHTGAERGNYSERGVRIPGFGSWED